MKALIPTLLLACILSGCGQTASSLKQLHSWATGLDRVVTLYASDGHVIKEWRTRAQIEDRGGTVFFVCNGKAVTVSGQFTVEEL